MPIDQETHGSHERCAGCSATLVADQRYCLRCGARRGRPRLDFTAFWRPLFPTDARREPSDARSTTDTTGEAAGVHRPRVATAEGRGRAEAADRPPSRATAPSRRLTGALAAGVLAGGILLGATLGPTPSNSPADASTLAQRAIAALVADTRSGPAASAPVDSTPSPGKPVSAAVSAPARKAKAKRAAAASTASEGATAGESPPPAASSEGSSSEGSSSEGSSSEGSSKSDAGKEAAPGTPFKLPPIKHVWLITLSGVSLKTALADSTADPYLAKQLASKGTSLSGFTLNASSALGNEIALLSGQGVNLDTEQNCPSYVALEPPTVNATNGLAEGVGCVYPATVKTLADELTAAGLTWRAYVQDMEAGAPGAGSAADAPSGTSQAPSTDAPTTGSPPGGTTSTPSTTPSSIAGGVSCRHPELGGVDVDHAPVAGDPYLTYRNPFVYFDSVLETGACASDDVDLDHLRGDLASTADTPSLSWIVPSACDDGSANPCAPGAADGLGPADVFLKEVVGEILATAAYREAGLIAIVPDSLPGASPSGPAGASSDPSANATAPAGALLLSPFVRRGARVSETFNDFSLLQSLTRLFGVLPLGHANDSGTVSFGATVYSTTEKAAQAASRPRRLVASHAGG